MSKSKFKSLFLGTILFSLVLINLNAVKVHAILPNDKPAGDITPMEYTIDIPVEKVWVDNDDKAGFRPKSVIVVLKQKVDGKQKTLELSAENDWKGVFKNLPKYCCGGDVEQNYSIEELEVPKYYTKIEGDQYKGYLLTNTRDSIDIDVEKIWLNNSPTTKSVTIRLIRGNATEVASIELTAKDDWKGTFFDVPEMTAGGDVKAVYSIKEDPLPGYKEPVYGGNMEDGFTVGNEKEPSPSDADNGGQEEEGGKGGAPQDPGSKVTDGELPKTGGIPMIIMLGAGLSIGAFGSLMSNKKK